RRYVIKVFGRIIMITPFHIHVSHTVKLFYNKNRISIYKKSRIGRVSNAFAVSPVITSFLVQVIDIAIHITAISEPPALINVMHGRSIDRAEGLPVPRNMINKFCNDITVITNMTNMCLVKLPPVIINLLDLLVGAFKKWNIIQIPLSIFLVILPGKFFMIRKLKLIFARTTNKENCCENCEQV